MYRMYQPRIHLLFMVWPFLQASDTLDDLACRTGLALSKKGSMVIDRKKHSKAATDPRVDASLGSSTTLVGRESYGPEEYELCTYGCNHHATHRRPKTHV